MSSLAKQLILQVILILLNAFFAATEIALISINEKKTRARAAAGDRKAARMLRMIEDPTSFLSTIQIGITLAGFLGSAFAADNFSERLTPFLMKLFSASAESFETFDTISVVLITLILSFFTLVFGELVPKRLAMKHKEKLAEAVSGTISGLALVLKPLVWFLSVSTNGVLRLFGVDPKEEEEPVSEEDIVLMLDAGADDGSLDKDDVDVIKKVFKLDSMTAEDVMTPRNAVSLLAEDADPAEIMAIIKTRGYSRIPVYSGNTDNIIGVLHTRNYLLRKDLPDFSIKSVLLEPMFVPETAHLDTIFRDMQKSHTHLAIVVDEYGETAGIVSMEDILEELVGEIWDEQDRAVDNVQEEADGTFLVRCSMSLSDFEGLFHVNISDKVEASTVNGWVADAIGRIPEEKDHFDWENLTIEVIVADRLMAREIRVEVKQEGEHDEV